MNRCDVVSKNIFGPLRFRVCGPTMKSVRSEAETVTFTFLPFYVLFSFCDFGLKFRDALPPPSGLECGAGF